MENFGLTLEIIENINAVFSQNQKVDKVLVFGSRAKGNYRDGSDIDIAIKGQDLDFSDILKITGRLDDLDLPYKIDLLDYDKISEPALTEHIDRVGIEFYSRSCYKKLKNAGCSFLSGYAFKSIDYSNYGIPLIKIGNIQDRVVTVDDFGNFISEEIITEKLSKYLLKNNDILIAMTGQGSVGRVGKLRLKNREAVLNQRVGKFICDEISLNIDYLFYVLTSNKYQDLLFNAGSGSGQPNLSPELILETEIPWVNYKEQVAIVNILASLDNKIDLLQLQNKTLEQLAEILFRQWFIDEAEEIWEVGIILDLFILQRGYDLPSQNRTEGIYPILSSSGITAYHKDFKTKGPGVTTGRSGVIGEVFYITEDFWPLNTSLFVKEFKLATPLFAYFYLKILDLNGLNGGSAVPTLNRNNVHELTVKLPPKKLILDFEDIVFKYFEKIKLNRKQIDTLTKTRDNLLPKLMSGEIRVKLD